MTDRYPLLMAIAGGSLLALLTSTLGPLLNDPALVRWTVQMQDEEPARAAFALVAIRHLPIFLLAIAAGQVIFRVVRTTSVTAVLAAAAPWWLYVVVTGTMESVALGEDAFSWVFYDPAYFIWPHFVALPAGLLAASRMLQRVRRSG